MGDPTEVLLFIEQYLTDQDQKDNEMKRKAIKESEQKQLRMRKAIGGSAQLSDQKLREGNGAAGSH